LDAKIFGGAARRLRAARFKIVLRSIYLQHGKNLNTNVQEQVTTLNNYVLDHSVPNVLRG
jgi:hypothetical protein